MIKTGEDLLFYKKKYGFTYEDIAQLVGYRHWTTVQTHVKKKKGLINERAQIAYTILFEKIELNRGLLTFIKQRKLGALANVREGISLGRLPKGIEPRQLPSYDTVVSLLDEISGYLT